jgi:hypothetical protein
MTKDPEAMLKSLMRRNRHMTLRITPAELVHLRDVLSMTYPDMSKTLSQDLARQTNSEDIEASLWGKVERLLQEIGLPTGDDAPDYVVTAAAPPVLGIYRVQHDEASGEGE